MESRLDDCRLDEKTSWEIVSKIYDKIIIVTRLCANVVIKWFHSYDARYSQIYEIEVTLIEL